MDEKTKKRRSDRGKRYWARLSRLAALLGCTSGDANLIWRQLVHEDFVIPEEFDHDDVGMTAKEINACRSRVTELSGVKLPRTPGVRSRLANYNEAIPEDPKDPSVALRQRVKCAMWLIEKCGSVEKTQDALDRAKRSLS